MTERPSDAGSGDDYWADVVQERSELRVKVEDLMKQLMTSKGSVTKLEKENKELSLRIDELAKKQSALVREIDFRKIGSGSVGPVTKKLQDTFFATVKGKGDRSAEWLDYVKS